MFQHLLDSVRQDLWLGVRLLRRSPALTIVAVVSLGLGIGATTGVVAVGDALMIRPLPVQRPDELLIPQWRSTMWPKIGIWGSNDDDNNNWSFSYPMFEAFSQMRGFDVAGFQDLNGATTLVRGQAGTADGSLVTGNFFRVLGVAPVVGRLAGRSGQQPGRRAGRGDQPSLLAKGVRRRPGSGGARPACQWGGLHGHRSRPGVLLWRSPRPVDRFLRPGAADHERAHRVHLRIAVDQRSLLVAPVDRPPEA